MSERRVMRVLCTWDCGAQIEVPLPPATEGDFDEYNRQLGERIRGAIIAHVLLHCPIGQEHIRRETLDDG